MIFNSSVYLKILLMFFIKGESMYNIEKKAQFYIEAKRKDEEDEEEEDEWEDEEDEEEEEWEEEEEEEEEEEDEEWEDEEY
jgi:hypothetical protein